MDVRLSLPVSLRQLQYIVAIADLGGFRRAADTCGVAQPSLSAQVALAENALGVQIFERTHRRVRVTDAGRPLVEQARRVLVAAADLRELARQRADPFRGTLRIGVIPTVSPYLLPELSPSIGRAFPNLTILWSEERTRTLVRQADEGAVDAAILALEPQVAGLDHAVLGRDPFLLAASRRHPLSKTKRPATLDDLRKAQVLLLEDGHCFRDQAMALCRRAGASELGFRATSLSTLVQMTSAGAGVTLLPSIAVRVENRNGQLVTRRFSAPHPARTLVLAWRRGSALAGPLKTIADTMATVVASRRPRRVQKSTP
jgi:LysR family transcriptional regulator, hydrogen peroxide-inducible genes activator